MANGAPETIAGRSPPPRSMSTITVRSPSARTPSVVTSVEAPLSRSRAPLTSAISDASGDGCQPSNSRRQLWTTSSALSGVPSLNCEPLAQREGHGRPSSPTAHDSASAGRTLRRGVDGGQRLVQLAHVRGAAEVTVARGVDRGGRARDDGDRARVGGRDGAAARARPRGRPHADGEGEHDDQRAITATTARRRPDGGSTGPPGLDPVGRAELAAAADRRPAAPAARDGSGRPPRRGPRPPAVRDGSRDEPFQGPDRGLRHGSVPEPAGEPRYRPSDARRERSPGRRSRPDGFARMSRSPGRIGLAVPHRRGNDAVCEASAMDDARRSLWHGSGFVERVAAPGIAAG